jgi:hypothetical protein
MQKLEINQELLKQRFNYNPEIGLFIRKMKTAPGVKIGTVAGSKGCGGYIVITFNRRQKHLAHRLAWLYVYGYFPRHQLDHINGIRDDNRIANLREATNKQNMENLNTKSSASSGIRGIASYKTKKSVKWVARIMHNYKTIHLGVFDNINEAINARKHGENKYFTHSK